jgi:methionine synthase II (cobalamin-independent)
VNDEAWIASGSSTGIGSLPHADPALAVSMSLACSPRLPAAPQLPQRSPGEGMIAQAARGLAGVDVTPDGAIAVEPSRFSADGCIDDPAPSRDDNAGLYAFLHEVRWRRGPVKLQLTGPITLGLALVHAGAPPKAAFAAALAAVRARGAALVALAAATAPHARPVVFVDEPGLVACRHPGFPLPVEEVIDVVSSALAALGAARTGVHCCGPTDWSIVTNAGADVLSLPVGAWAGDHSTALADHLERGGWIAWGAVPTTGPLGVGPEPLWRRLVDVWCELSAGGCDPTRLRRQALVTPVCGLAGHGEQQAEHVLRLAAAVGGRVLDEAVDVRLAIGA